MNLSKINRMYVLSFFFSLHIALSAYVNSTFLTGIISEKYVGLLFTMASIITLVLLLKSSKILTYFGNRRLVLWLLLINMLSLVGLVTSRNPYVISASFIGFLTTNTLVFLCLDIFIEHFGNSDSIGKTRGTYLTILNLAWVISPLITSILITQEGGYRAIYMISFLATIIMTIGMFFSVKTFSDKSYKKAPFLETFRDLQKIPHMKAVMMINFILQFFYVWMVIYTPIYLNKHMGLGWDELGLIFTVMLIPFIIFGLLVGILIDKFKVHKRTLLYIGFTIISLSTCAITFTTTKSIVLWAAILFLTRTGASIIETTSEIYFFTHANEEDSHLLGFFRDMSPVAYIIAPLIGTVIFFIVPFKFLFLILSVIVLLGLYYIPKLKHNHEHIISN